MPTTPIIPSVQPATFFTQFLTGRFVNYDDFCANDLELLPTGSAMLLTLSEVNSGGVSWLVNRFVEIQADYAADDIEIYALGMRAALDQPNNNGTTTLGTGRFTQAADNYGADNMEGYSLGTTEKLVGSATSGDTSLGTARFVTVEIT